MGQVASFFGITEPVFLRIEANPESFAYSADAFAVEGFSQSFEGLRYVLRKVCKPSVEGLVAQIFEPEKFLGEAPDYESVDWENLPDDFPVEGATLPYHNPEVINTLLSFLERVTEQEFASSFSAAELNEQQIYPSGIWNESTDPNNHFSKLNLVREFLKLKEFFSQLASAGTNPYCVVLIN